MRVLALEPYFGGSHKAFLEGWIRESRHAWTLLTLPPFQWKWRMRHSALTFSEQLSEGTLSREGPWDLIFATDMLDLAQFLGLAPPGLRTLPTVAYFHENQLTYPVRQEDPRDLHFAFTNFTSALAAEEVWFNSKFHLEALLSALEEMFRGLPEPRPAAQLAALQGKSLVRPQGIDPFPPRPSTRRPGPLRLLWAARWEHDKNPRGFFEAVKRLETSGADYRLSVVGESFRDVPAIFSRNRERFRHRIDHWGFLPERSEYRRALREADVFVSTADHEFFGVSAAEAMAAGTFPLLPDRLAYPELVAGLAETQRSRLLYDGTSEDLARRLERMARAVEAAAETNTTVIFGDPQDLVRAVQGFLWPNLRPRLDDALEGVASRTAGTACRAPTREA